MTIDYCLIAAGDPLYRVIQHPKQCPNIDDSISTVVNKVDASTPHKRTLNSDSLSIHYQVTNKVLFLCVTSRDTPIRTAYLLLDELAELVAKNRILVVDGNGGVTSVDHSTKKFLKERLKYYNDPSNDKLQKLNDKVNELKDVMVQNVDQIVETLSKSDVLENQSKQLDESGVDFARGSKSVRNRSCILS